MFESWMLARLHRETEVFHATADAGRMVLMKDSVSPEDYRSFLTLIYGFEAPVAAALSMTAGLDTWFDMRGRGQVRLLRADLAALGIVDATDVPRAGIAPFATPATALGWLYVVERNTLVHGILERHLRQKLPAQLKTAGSYLAAPNRSTKARWRELGDALDRCGRTLREADQIVSAARAAFRCQRGWYQELPVVERVA